MDCELAGSRIAIWCWVMSWLEHELGQEALAELIFQAAQTIEQSFDVDRLDVHEILRLMAA